MELEKWLQMVGDTDDSERNLFGGIIVDEIGLGKTYEAIGYIATMAKIIDRESNVQGYPDNYLLPGASVPNAICPCTSLFGV